MPLGGDPGGITMAVRSSGATIGEGCDAGGSEAAGDELGCSDGLVSVVPEGSSPPEQAARAASNTAAPRPPIGWRGNDFPGAITAMSSMARLANWLTAP